MSLSLTEEERYEYMHAITKTMTPFLKYNAFSPLLVKHAFEHWDSEGRKLLPPKQFLEWISTYYDPLKAEGTVRQIVGETPIQSEFPRRQVLERIRKDKKYRQHLSYEFARISPSFATMRANFPTISEYLASTYTVMGFLPLDVEGKYRGREEVKTLKVIRQDALKYYKGLEEGPQKKAIGENLLKLFRQHVVYSLTHGYEGWSSALEDAIEVIDNTDNILTGSAETMSLYRDATAYISYYTEDKTLIEKADKKYLALLHKIVNDNPYTPMLGRLYNAPYDPFLLSEDELIISPLQGTVFADAYKLKYSEHFPSAEVDKSNPFANIMLLSRLYNAVAFNVDNYPNREEFEKHLQITGALKYISRNIERR